MIGKIFAVIAGFFSGGVIALLIKIRSARKKINDDLQKIAVNELTDGQREEVSQIVSEKRKTYKKQNKGVVFRSVLGLKKKKQSVFPKAYFDIIKAVSLVFDKDRQMPFLNFSIKSGFDFLQKVVDRFESVLNATEISILKNLNISLLANVTSVTSKIFSNKTVKGVMSTKTKILNVLKIFNPYYWIKKIVLSVFFTRIINELLLASVDIVAWEFARFYEQGQSQIELKTA